MEGMSKQQQAVYDFIWHFRDGHGFCASIADVAEGLDLATSTVATYVEALIEKGYVTSKYGVPRSLQAIKKGEQK
jgi:SOS-response transcriptional repressor LexA